MEMQLYGDADFLFQQDLAPAHSAKTTTTFADRLLLFLTGQPTHLTCTSQRICGFCQEEDKKHRSKTTGEPKAAIKAAWASLTPQQCYRLIASIPCHADAVICGNRSPPTSLYRHFCMLKN